jgi:hypothetical protein
MEAMALEQMPTNPESFRGRVGKETLVPISISIKERADLTGF